MKTRFKESYGSLKIKLSVNNSLRLVETMTVGSEASLRLVASLNRSIWVKDSMRVRKRAIPFRKLVALAYSSMMTRV